LAREEEKNDNEENTLEDFSYPEKHSRERLLSEISWGKCDENNSSVDQQREEENDGSQENIVKKINCSPGKKKMKTTKKPTSYE